MIKITTINKKKIALTIILSIGMFYLFSHALIITNKINFYINKKIILQEIKASPLIEGEFLKSHIDAVLPIIKVVQNKDKKTISDDKDIRWLTEIVTGFDIKNPKTIISSQVLLMKKLETRMVSALGTSTESKSFSLRSREENTKKLPAPRADLKSNNKNDSKDIDATKEDMGEIDEAKTKEVTIHNPTNEKGYEYVEGIYVKNEAQKSLDIAALLKEKVNINLSGKGPHVLIVHTHTSEAYTPTKNNNYTPSDPDRTEDPKYNVVRIGEEIAKNLRSMGIEVIHDKTVHDYPSYSGSYRKTLETIQSQLQKNPSIKFVFDIHRDALIMEDGKKLRVTAEIEKQKVAQVMLVVGTDQGGLEHPKWKENLKLALKLQHKLLELYPKFARPIHLAPYRYNQHTTTGSLIIEVGSNGNTLEEALSSSKYIAKAIAEVIKEIK
ncbi:MAG: stage sporulation protein [Clostridiales bacterium]|nr:stage sporulation protein [Clostridiales bacterium]